MKRIKAIVGWFGQKKKRLAILVLPIAAVVGWYLVFGRTSQQTQYQTATVERGTLVSTVSASGLISNGDRQSVMTQASGVVKSVLVKNGDRVKAGQMLAQIVPNQDSAQKQTAAWSSYLSAKNSLAATQANLYTLQSQEFAANQKFINDAVARDLATDDPTYIQENATWLAAEATYKNQQGVISQAQANMSSAWMSYQQFSSNITAPIGGSVSDLALAPGLQLAAVSGSSSSTNQSQQVASIIISGVPQAVVDLSEVDVTKVKAGQKVTMTLDSQSGKTFAGVVVGVNTAGTVSSGVTNYPAVVSFETGASNIYPNMSVTASIITDVRDNVMFVPSGAVQTVNGQSEVRLLKNGQVEQVAVQTGLVSDTQTEIVSGLSEGDQVVTGTVTTSTQSSGSQSPFSQTRGGVGGVRFGGVGGGR